MKFHDKIKQAYKALNGHFPTNLVIFHYKGYRVTKADFARRREWLNANS